MNKNKKVCPRGELSRVLHFYTVGAESGTESHGDVYIGEILLR